MEESILEFVNSGESLPNFTYSNDEDLKLAAKWLAEIIKSEEPFKKLRSLKLVRSISEYSPSFLSYIGKHLLKRLYGYALFNKESNDPGKGRLLFESADSINEEASEQFLLLVLDSIDFWNQLFKTTNRENSFNKTYLNLTESGVTFLKIIPSEKDLERKISEITEGLRRLKLSFHGSDDIDSIKKPLMDLKHFKRSLKILSQRSPKLNEKFLTDLAVVSNELRRLYDQYKAVKNAGLIKKDLNEPIPKPAPRPDSPIFLDTTNEAVEELATDQGHETEWQDIVSYI